MRVGEVGERISDSWWPVPTAGAVGAVVAAGVLIALDNALHPPPLIAFRGDASEARLLMSTITSAMLTFVGLVFSVSIVVFTLASGQFSPRVLRTFLRDRWSQSTLAVFVATFVLALITFWAVRGSEGEGDAFVPGLTITVVFLLVGACVGLFVHFVHHITQQIRAVTVIDRIFAETVTTIDHRYPDPVDAERPAPHWTPTDTPRVLRSDSTGVLANVSFDALVRLARRHDVVFELVPSLGSYVIEGRTTVRQHGDAPVPPHKVRDALAFDKERSYRRDVAFGIRKLLDIAERAMSPGVNDPTTAAQCIDRLHAIADRLAGRRLDVGEHLDDDGVVRVVEPVPSWSDYLALICDEARHWGADSIRVHERLRAMLTDLVEVSPADRRPVLRSQLDALADRAASDLPEVERRAIDDAALPSRRPQQPS